MYSSRSSIISLIQLKSPHGASKIFFILYLLIISLICFLIFPVFLISEPPPERLSVEPQKLVL